MIEVFGKIYTTANCIKNPVAPDHLRYFNLHFTCKINLKAYIDLTLCFLGPRAICLKIGMDFLGFFLNIW